MKRVSIVFLTFVIAFAIILLRLFSWQVLSYGKLSEEASSQHYYNLVLPAKRGEILAIDKSPLVSNQRAFLVYAEPKKITNPDKFSNEVGEILGIEDDELNDRISQENIAWAMIDRKVNEESVKDLQKRDIKGLGFEKEGKRFYPEASMAAQLLGFVAFDKNGKEKGYFGIEGYYDRELRGRDGSLVQEKDARGFPILLGEEKRFIPEDGRTLVLYLDKTVQRIIERNLRIGMKKYGAKEGMVVVLDPKTGGIIGVSAEPSYDPSDYLKYSKDRYKNPVVASSYEPGSTFKILMMAAALNEKVVKPETKFDEKGPIQIDDYSIKTWNNEYHGKISMTEVLQYSSNVGMVFVGEKLGKEKILFYLEKYGFGKPTGIDLEEESAPSLRASNQWKRIDLATATFGQGIAVTPIQMIQAAAALANGGKLMEPHIVKEIIDSNGSIMKIKPKVVEKVISSSAAKAVTEMMVQAVDKGEAQWAKPKGYRIAGKTGTAQIPISGHYDPEKTIASFIGFAPADDPKFAMLVTFREPTSSPWGSETAAPLFFKITQELFSYYGISPSN